MRFLLMIGILLLKLNLAQAQSSDVMAIYCDAANTAIADSRYYTLRPGEVKELIVDLKSDCLLYTQLDATLQIGVSFKGDPDWKRGKDQIALQGLVFEVYDVATGRNLVDMVKSAGGSACNYGSGFVFSDLRAFPMVLRPVRLRLRNIGRNTVDAAYTLIYNNDQTLASKCADYPRGR
ncbi:hypothetical protein [Bdellovibrio sp. HCB2-146]|uniref:hypothetical protein n=1 Tax=Bdellovibrio sp. HCB2-146 TaxID=3394362 RepID=UPI0039BD575A